jgi:CHAT domain-containing protein
VLWREGNGATQLTWLDLGPTESIDAHVEPWRKGLLENKSRLVRGARRFTPSETPADQQAGAQLRSRLWDPVAKLVRNCQHIYIVPDGQLHRIAWAALPGNKPGTFLLQDHVISLLDRGSELVGRGNRSDTDTEANVLLVGNVDYQTEPSSSASEISATAIATTRGPADRDGWPWQALKGTAKELEAITGLLPRDYSVERLETSAATENEVLSALSTCRIAHLATHGFFSAPKFRAVGHSGSRWDDPVLASPVGRNPLTLSGLVCAHANRLPLRDEQGVPRGPDGLLTAEELCDLDLSGLELAVLSACETGLGHVAGGEGVWGLHRALSLAGARTTVSSLWKVDDRATAALMTEFYRQFLAGDCSKAEALRNAQLMILTRYDPITGSPLRFAEDPLPPFYWAAFQLAGCAD